MDITKLSETVPTKTHPASTVFEKSQRIPAVKRQLKSSYDDIMGDLEGDLKPYRDDSLICQLFDGVGGTG